MGRPSSIERLAGLLAVAAILAPDTARADDPWLLGLEADAAIPMLSPTWDRFQPGAAASASLFFAPTDALAFGVRLRAGFLTDGPAPDDATLADPGVGDLYTGGLALRLRPLAGAMPTASRGTGWIVELGGAAALTGGIVRPAAEAAMGWGFEVGDVDLTPTVRWLTVFEVDNQLEDRPAHVLMAGLEVTFFDAREAPPELPPAPPGDRDGDGILDPVDACTEVPEDFDDFQDDDGCPEPDNDSDGILDEPDQCPNEPEDFDGWLDDDGCPDPDNDHDGIRDVNDACPNEAEVINGVDDQDGCPDEGLIEMVDDRIVLEDRVFFDFSRARIRVAAVPVLEALVELFRQHPEWSLIRIEGHADVRGSREGNQRLSEMRSQRVRDALVAMGLESVRVDAVGYGDRRPVNEGHSEAAHQANRRVEFVVVEQRDLTPAEQVERDARAERELAARQARAAELAEESSR